jgi:hypothetical protein
VVEQKPYGGHPGISVLMLSVSPKHVQQPYLLNSAHPFHKLDKILVQIYNFSAEGYW